MLTKLAKDRACKFAIPALLGGLVAGTAFFAGPAAQATTFILDAADARLLCEGEPPRALRRNGHTVVVPSNGPETLNRCLLEIDFRFRGENGPMTVRRQWPNRGFVEIMHLRDGAPMEPQRLLFKDNPTGISYEPLEGEGGYRVRFALNRLFIAGGERRVWALVGVRVRNGASEQGYYSVSQTIELDAHGTQTRSAVSEPGN